MNNTEVVISFLASSGILVSGLGYILKRFIGGIDKRFDALILEVQGMRKDLHSKDLTDKEQDGVIQGLRDRVTNAEGRLNSHSDRIRRIEMQNN